MMAIQRGRLFIQIRRLNKGGYFSPPAYLAVMDIGTEQLIDADPQRPGIQAIELLGTFPKHKMEQAEREDRLYVSATGIPFDDGGLEAVDTVRLRSLGLVVAEADGQVGVDLASFVFVGPHGGFLAYTTDIAVSSHLHSFSLTGEVGEIILDENGELVEQTSPVFMPIKQVGTMNHHIIVKTVDEKLYRADKNIMSWQPYSETDSVWSASSELPGEWQQKIKRQFRGNNLTLERVLTDLHNGRILNTGLGPYIMDAGAILLLLFGACLSWTIFTKQQ